MTRDDAIAQRHIRAFVGLYPWVDISAKIPFPPELPPGSTSHRLMPFPEQYLFVNAYVQPPFRLDDPNVSPALVSDDGLAQAFQAANGKRKKQALFLCGDLDNITPQVKTLATRLRSLGIDAIYKEFKDCGHSFDKLARKGTWEGARKSEAYAEAVEFLRAVHQVS
ncbi:hypothetical protein DL93DRAFT_2069657 [Clavulina sp. PMI_390]|nr:hypothetical protein DL93DRAFT_2069657 [Clavulina sp. PMI_390]